MDHWPVASWFSFPTSETIKNIGPQQPRWNQEAVAMCLQRGYKRTELLTKIDEQIGIRWRCVGSTFGQRTGALNKVLIECVNAVAGALSTTNLYEEHMPHWRGEAARVKKRKKHQKRQKHFLNLAVGVFGPLARSG